MLAPQEAHRVLSDAVEYYTDDRTTDEMRSEMRDALAMFQQLINKESEGEQE